METVLRQGVWLVSAQILTRAIGFFYTIFLARSLGVAGFGLYSVALAYFAIISAAADFGFSRFLIRELAKDIKKSPELVCNVALLRLSFASALFATAALVLYFTDPDKLRVGLVLLGVMAVLPQTIASVLDAVFAALQKLRYSALALFLSSLITAISGYTLIQLSFGTAGAVSALIIGQVVLVLLLWIFLFRVKVVTLSLVTSSAVKEILKGSLPYGLLGILGMLYFRVDTLLLSYMRGSFETGLYSAGYKFLDAVIFIPSALSVTLFPLLAKLQEQDPMAVKKLYFKSLKMMTVVGIIILAGYVLLLPFIIRILLPSYTGAIQAVLILSLAIPFIFAHAPAIQVLFSTDKFLKPVIKLSFVTLGFNVVLNLVFIPIYGLYAAAWITVFSEVLSFIIFFRLLQVRVFKK